MLDHLGRIEAVEAGQEVGDLIERRLRFALGGGVNFHPIAGRKQHRLDAGKHPPPVVQRFASLLGRKRQPLAERDRRAVMAATDDLRLAWPASGDKAEGGRRKAEGGRRKATRFGSEDGDVAMVATIATCVSMSMTRCQ